MGYNGPPKGQKPPLDNNPPPPPRKFPAKRIEPVDKPKVEGSLFKYLLGFLVGVSLERD